MSTPNHSPSAPNLAKLSLGTAPDSWGVWFPRDDHQVGWEQYLDEVARAGYLYTELGPQGFLPQDPAQLRDELAPVPSSESWWDVPVSQVSELDSTQNAYKAYEEHKSRQRPYLTPSEGKQ